MYAGCGVVSLMMNNKLKRKNTQKKKKMSHRYAGNTSTVQKNASAALSLPPVAAIGQQGDVGSLRNVQRAQANKEVVEELKEKLPRVNTSPSSSSSFKHVGLGVIIGGISVVAILGFIAWKKYNRRYA